MSRVLVEYEKDDNTSAVNNSGLLRLQADRRIELRIKRICDITATDIKWCNVYIACRPFSPTSAWLAKKSKSAGRFYICYFDDDLLDEAQKEVLGLRIKSANKCLAYADALISGNPLIVQAYAPKTRSGRAAILNQTVEEGDIVPPSTVRHKVKIVYAAGKDHAPLFDRYILPIMGRLFERYKEGISLTLVGARPAIPDMLLERYDIQYVPLMPLETYRQYMTESRFHIGLAPLSNEPFHNKKYFNKFFEYSMAGIAGAYANCMPYTLVIEDKVNGMLVDDEPDCWYASLCEMIDQEALRLACVHNAQKQLRTTFSLRTQIQELVAAVPELVHSSGGEGVVKAVGNIGFKYRMFSLYDKLFKLIRHIRNYGFRGIWIKYREYLHNRHTFRRV